MAGRGSQADPYAVTNPDGTPIGTNSATASGIGATTDAESTSGNGSVIAILKNVRTRIAAVVTALAGGLPAALTTAGNLKVAMLEGSPIAGDGRKTVTAFGTAEAIAASTSAKWVVCSALTVNTQQVNVGGSTVLAASGSSRGIPLLPGDSTPPIPITNLNQVFVDSRVNGEGVSFYYGA